MTLSFGLWFWGVAGAFIYAGPKWSACIHEKGLRVRCLTDLLTALLIGAICGEAFGPVVVAYLKLKPVYGSGAAALIGLLANPYAPKLIDVLGSLATNILSDKMRSIFKGETK